MRKGLILFILILISSIAYSQTFNEIINSYFIKYQLYPISLPDLFVEPGLIGDIESIEQTTNDTTHFQVLFDNSKICAVIFDSTRINLSYRFGYLSKIIYFKHDSIIDQTKIKNFLPFICIHNKSQEYSAFKTFGKIKEIKSSSGFTIYDKTKFNYKKGRVYKIKNYNWRTISQKCYYSGYTTYDYTNDTIVIEKLFDSNDSLAFMNTNVFDSKGNILNVKSLIKKRATGWGIDVRYYSYDATESQNRTFDYKFDSKGNWIEKMEYLDNKLKNKTIRKIIYKN